MKTKTTKTKKQIGQPKTSPEMDDTDRMLIVSLPDPEISAVERLADLLGNDNSGMLLGVVNASLEFWGWAELKSKLPRRRGARK